MEYIVVHCRSGNLKPKKTIKELVKIEIKIEQKNVDYGRLIQCELWSTIKNVSQKSDLKKSLQKLR